MVLGPAILAVVLVASAQSTGQLSPTSDVSGNRVRATGASTSRALRDRFADVLNVKDFGAVGNGTADDTAAFQAALDAAAAASTVASGWPGFVRGKTVFAPAGVYNLTQKITGTAGTSLKGAGRRATQLKINHADATDDGIAWTGPGASVDLGAMLADMSVVAVSTRTVRDLVSLYRIEEVEISNVHLDAAGRYGISFTEVWDTVVRNVLVTGSVSAGAWVGDNGLISTTIRFDRSYFSGTLDGPGASVLGVQINFNDCVFQSTGATTRSLGDGIEIRSGVASLLNPYFENVGNRGIVIGTSDDATVNVVTPSFVAGAYTNWDAPRIYGDRWVAGSIVGGSFYIFAHPIELTSNASNVSIVNPKINAVPEYDNAGGKTIYDFPGWAQFIEPSSGSPVMVSRGFTLRSDNAKNLVARGTALAGSTGSDVKVGSTNWRTAGTLFDVQNAGTTVVAVDYAGNILLHAGNVWQSSGAGIDINANRAAGYTGRDIGLYAQQIRTAGRLVGIGDASGEKSWFTYQGALGQTGVAFADLGTPADGTLLYCTNCTVANPCAAGGTGAFAKRLNGAWVCN
jgi:hypothetical protein